jgi:hypothetical protein
MSRKTLLSMLVMIVSALLAVALFIKGLFGWNPNARALTLERLTKPFSTLESIRSKQMQPMALALEGYT